MKDEKEISDALKGKILDIYEIDEYMVAAGYNSILPVDEKNIRETKIIWYPFEPFISQINLLIKVVGDKYLIQHVETTH
jgi:hypothetical protein